MQELQSGYNFSRIKSGPGLWKASAHLYMKHQVAAIQVFHNEKEMTLNIFVDNHQIGAHRVRKANGREFKLR